MFARTARRASHVRALSIQQWKYTQEGGVSAKAIRSNIYRIMPLEAGNLQPGLA